MAIQHRRGVYDRFDPTRMTPGEWAIVLSGDPDAADGMTAYMCFAAGTVKRMATYEDMVENITEATSEISESFTQAVVQATDRAETAAEAAETGEASRVAAEQGRVAAEQGRVTAESSRVTAETQRVTRFAEIEQLAKGWTIHHCTTSEYDATTRVPTVADPDPATLYCVPNSSGGDDAWVEWRYDTETEAFETVGSTSANTSPISTATIDSIVADTAETGTEVLQTTGLTYLWTKLKAAFAAIVHSHLTLGETGQAPIVSTNPTYYSVSESRGSATGLYSHAEGTNTQATGENSHAEGLYTYARGKYQHAGGRHNVIDWNNKYAEIIGNGYVDNRSNARTLDWDGNAWFAGDVTATETITDGDVATAKEHKLSEKADAAHAHSTSDITSGTLPVARGGTGASDAAGARTNLGAAASSHTHAVSDIASGVLPITNGGTGASTAAGAAVNIVDGQAIEPASVTASGEVIATEHSSSGGGDLFPQSYTEHRLTEKANQTDVTALQTAIGTVDVSTDGDLQSQIDALGESVSRFNLTNATRISFRTIQNGIRILIWSSDAELYLLDIAQTSTLKKSVDSGQTYTTVKTW